VSDPAKGSRLLSVAEAQAIVLRQTRPLPDQLATLMAAALGGNVLAADVASDLDMPPYDKALMDGYAVRCADLPEGRGELRVLEEITAGQTPRQRLGPGTASRIMTGAPIPPGADAVVIVERTRMGDDGRVRIEDRPPRPGQNVLPRGREMRAGEVVLKTGSVLRPQEIGMLAAVGWPTVPVVPRPRIAVLSTGDELVEAPQRPGPGQIRNSNGPMLVALAARDGESRYLGIAGDRLDSLAPLVDEGLRYDALILSGGVSAGKLDLVPGVLQGAGVTAHFHKVAMKPGKPVLFGTRDDAEGRRTLVFGLPGNPVSSLACYALFVRPGLRRLAGHADAGPRTASATLAADFPYNTDRPTYHPAHLEAAGTGWRVQPVPWFGSADLRGLAGANALVVLPAGDHCHRAGQGFDVIMLE
jgi:molybdopterin molybdotransferase